MIEKIVYRYSIRVEDNIKKIISTISKDTLVYKAIRKYPGLRLMRQEPHQCIFSFVCARRILRAISRYYSWLFNENENENKYKMTERITINQYKVLSAIMRKYFGKYSGYAQLYIFYYMRESSGNRW